jgi:molecular chaperone GrpE
MNEPEVNETKGEGGEKALQDEATTDTSEMSAEEISAEELKGLQEKAAKADEYWDRLLRERAEVENYKKRVARERTDAIKYANESILQKLIPVMDNFEAALAAFSSEQANTQTLQQGVSMISSQLKSALQDAGLEQIDATGQPFDPALHEAVSQQESPDVPEGQVLQQLRKGYKLRDRLIRPATVVVAKKPGA